MTEMCILSRGREADKKLQPVLIETHIDRSGRLPSKKGEGLIGCWADLGWVLSSNYSITQQVK